MSISEPIGCLNQQLLRAWPWERRIGGYFEGGPQIGDVVGLSSHFSGFGKPTMSDSEHELPIYNDTLKKYRQKWTCATKFL